jgi:hypothetical protein
VIADLETRQWLAGPDLADLDFSIGQVTTGYELFVEICLLDICRSS